MSLNPPPRKNKTAGRLLNLSIGAMLLVCSGILVKRYYSGAGAGPALSPSARINVAGLDLSQTPRTLLLAVARDCEYCTDSARFYRRLAQGLSGRGDIRVVALFPDSPREGRHHLDRLGIALDEVVEANLPSLGIRNVPTLVLLNREGVVSDVWVGKLPPLKESEVLRRLGLGDARPTSEWLIAEDELRRRLAAGEEVVVVDLRERNLYAQGHFPGARNIPADELRTRAANELPRTATIVLSGADPAVADWSYTALSNENFQKVLILNQKPNSP